MDKKKKKNSGNWNTQKRNQQNKENNNAVCYEFSLIYVSNFFSTLWFRLNLPCSHRLNWDGVRPICSAIKDFFTPFLLIKSITDSFNNQYSFHNNIAPTAWLTASAMWYILTTMQYSEYPHYPVHSCNVQPCLMPYVVLHNCIQHIIKHSIYHILD